MPIKILMPALSPTMTEGSLAHWHKREGEQVTTGDVLAEIETDKATMEIEATDDGTLGRIVVPDGTQGVEVNQLIGIMLAEGEDAAVLDSVETQTSAAPAPAAPATPAVSAAPSAAEDISASPLARRLAEQAGIDIAAVTGTGAHGRITRADIQAAISGGGGVAAAAASTATPASRRTAASPLARRIATERGIDLASVIGTGPEGRIVRADLDTASPATAPAAAQGTAGGAIEPLNAMRRVIAERMTLAKQTVPHFYLTVDCEIDELLAERKALNASAQGLKLSINDFIIRAVALALMEVPEANVTWDESGDGPAMRRYAGADVSVAVAIEGGLITPVIRAAETKGLGQISSEIAELAGRARDGKLAPEEYQGGSFTISNLGMYGIKTFDAIINPPQSGILAVGAGEQRPVVKGGALAIATVMSLTLSCDHRVVDGAIGARLLTAIKRLLEYPPQMLL